MEDTTNTYDEQNDQKNPLENPLFRYGIGFSGAAIVAAVALLYLEGTLRTIVLVIAVLDAFVTPKLLEIAGTEQGSR